MSFGKTNICRSSDTPISKVIVCSVPYTFECGSDRKRNRTFTRVKLAATSIHAAPPHNSASQRLFVRVLLSESVLSQTISPADAQKNLDILAFQLDSNYQ